MWFDQYMEAWNSQSLWRHAVRREGGMRETLDAADRQTRGTLPCAAAEGKSSFARETRCVREQNTNRRNIAIRNPGGPLV